jgi:hypothetical protein
MKQLFRSDALTISTFAVMSPPVRVFGPIGEEARFALGQR